MHATPEAPREIVITEADCRLLLASQRVGRLVVADDVPTVRPVNFVMAGDEIVFRLDRPLPDDVVVAFEVDQVDAIERQGWSVVVTGRARCVAAHLVGDDIRERLDTWAADTRAWCVIIEIVQASGRWVRGGRVRQDLDDRGYL